MSGLKQGESSQSVQLWLDFQGQKAKYVQQIFVIIGNLDKRNYDLNYKFHFKIQNIFLKTDWGYLFSKIKTTLAVFRSPYIE